MTTIHQVKTVQTVDSLVIPGLLAHALYVTDATNVATFTNIVGIGYHLQEQLVHPKAVITTENDYHAPDTLEIDTITEEATVDLMLGLIQETEVQAAQDTPAQTDTPAGTETLDKGTCRTTTKLKTDHTTGSDQVAIDHQLPMLGIVLEADHPHAAMRSHPDAV